MKKILIAILICLASVTAVAQTNFTSPFLTAGAGLTLNYSTGSLFQGGAVVSITGATLTMTNTEASCAAPAYSACNFVYWTSGTSLSTTTTLATAAASGNIIVGFVTTAAGAITVITHAEFAMPGPLGVAQAISTTLTPSTAAGVGLGTAALPFSNLIVGTAATNVFTVTPASATAARAITLADPGGAATLMYTNATASQTVSGLNTFTGNKAQITSDFTDANSASLQAITGLGIAVVSTFTGPLSFHCGIRYSQATAVAGDQFGIASLTTAATRLDAGGLVSTNATTVTQGFLDNLTTTTPTAIVTFTPAVTTELQATLDGTVQVAAGGSVIQFYVLNGTAANVIVVKAGSYCTLM
jgi:hypothetical protein